LTLCVVLMRNVLLCRVLRVAPSVYFPLLHFILSKLMSLVIKRNVRDIPILVGPSKIIFTSGVRLLSYSKRCLQLEYISHSCHFDGLFCICFVMSDFITCSNKKMRNWSTKAELCAAHLSDVLNLAANCCTVKTEKVFSLESRLHQIHLVIWHVDQIQCVKNSELGFRNRFSSRIATDVSSGAVWTAMPTH
jgi:hypothetical protein